MFLLGKTPSFHLILSPLILSPAPPALICESETQQET